MPGNLLTITRAATLLNVSREFMVKLLDERTIPSVGVGARRRIEEPVLLAFRERRNAARHEAIQQMARDAVEAGVYDLVILPEGAEDE
ncbi:MAG: helix-turn-helix domain-containing protein [Bryobacteraceae bacterium]